MAGNGREDMIDHEGAKRTVGIIGIEEGIDHRQSVAHDIGERHGDQLAFTLLGDEGIRPAAAVFDDLGGDVGVFDHHRIVEHRHFRHAALVVPRIEIAPEQGVLFGRRFRLVDIADQVPVVVPDPAHGFVLLELPGQNPHGNAGPAILAGRPVGNVLGTAETALGQEIIQLGGAPADEMRKNLALQLPFQIGTGRGCCQEELR